MISYTELDEERGQVSLILLQRCNDLPFGVHLLRHVDSSSSLLPRTSTAIISLIPTGTTFGFWVTRSGNLQQLRSNPRGVLCPPHCRCFSSVVFRNAGRG